MTQKDQKIISLNEAIEDNQSSNKNLTLMRRSEVLPIKRNLGSDPSSLMLPTRRQFLATASMATAGLFIKPLENFAAFPSNSWYGIKEFFSTFFNAIKLQTLEALPLWLNGLEQGLLSQVGNFWRSWSIDLSGCFGNNPAPSFVERILTKFIPRRLLNAAAPYFRKWLTNGIKPMFSLPAIYGIGDTATAILSKKTNLESATAFLPNTSVRFLPAVHSSEREAMIALQNEIKIKQEYFLPRTDGDFGNIAQKTLKEPRSLARAYEEPQFFEAEKGALVLINYEIDRAFRDGQEGIGRSKVIVVPPKNRSVRRWISRNSNFWTNADQRKELMRLMTLNSAEGVKTDGSTFSFAVGD